MSVSVEGIEAINAKFRQLAKQVVTPKEKQRVLASGTPPIVRETAKMAKKSKYDHTFYSKGKKYIIKSGNLKKSIRSYKQRDGNISIGPKVLKKLSIGEIGASSKTASGYYAHMVYKTATNFRQTVTERAVTKTLQKSLQAMEKAVARILKKYE